MAKPKTYFGLVHSDVRFDSPWSNGLAPPSGGELTWWQRKVDEEARKQQLVIAEQAIKTCYGMEKTGEIQRHGYQVFNETLDAIVAIQRQPRDKEHQAIVDAFTEMTVNGLGSRMLRAMDAGSAGIAAEIARSLYPVPDPPERKGLLRRIFG